MEPRSLSAAFHSVSFSSFIVDGAVGAAFFLGGMVNLPPGRAGFLR